MHANWCWWWCASTTTTTRALLLSQWTHLVWESIRRQHIAATITERSWSRITKYFCVIWPFFPFIFFLPTAADKYCIFNFIQSSIAPVVWQIFICPFYAKSLLLYCFCVCTRWVCCVCPRQTASVWCAVQQCRCVQWLVRGLICSEWVRENVVFMYSCCAEYRFPMIGLAHKHTSYLPTIHSFSNMLSLPSPPLGHRYSSRLSGGRGWDTLTFVYPIFLCHEFSILQEMSIYKFALLALLYFPHIEQFCILNHTFIHSCYLTKHCILYICMYIVYTCLYIVFLIPGKLDYNR